MTAGRLCGCGGVSALKAIWLLEKPARDDGGGAGSLGVIRHIAETKRMSECKGGGEGQGIAVARRWTSTVSAQEDSTYGGFYSCVVQEVPC